MTTSIRSDFDVETSTTTFGFNFPQRLGRLLWAPMLAMALMAFPVGLLIAGVRATTIQQGGDAATVAALGQFGPALMFIGFAAVFAAVSFSIARVLGTLRNGSGLVQQATGGTVQALRMLPTGKAFIGLMVMAMMILVGAVIAHFIVGAAILGGDASALASAETWSIRLEAVRRVGVIVYLVAITLGLATIAEVIRFQAIRLRELPAEAAR
jgi:uncharacterized membrane protein YjgN (DUF898 family)